jgi:hypothetical protein
VPTHAVTTSSSNVRLPATFTIEPNGALTPATISAPAGVTVDLTVVSRSSRAHRVVIEASPRRALTVPAAGRASVTIEGLKNGRYPVDLDGVARGALTMGAAPGP